MKKSHPHLFSRKNRSLYDTNVKMQDMENAELVLRSSAIAESGTASVRARPTVKHHATSESFQGFAVPTPTVPLMGQLNNANTNSSVAEDRMSNGSASSMPDLVEGEIDVPPPPSIAPPPPPSAAEFQALPMTFILPPPDFLGDLNSPDLANLQPPSMPPPKPPSLPLSSEELELSLLQPPSMVPPKPPSTCSTGSASSMSSSSLPPAKVPEPPKFAAPQLPNEKQDKTIKKPPPKPLRSSSISSLDSPPLTPAPPPPVETHRLSTFNPQNPAKVISNTTFLEQNEGHDARPKQMLLLEDSKSVNSVPTILHTDEQNPKMVTPPKSKAENVTELQQNSKMIRPPQILRPEVHRDAKVETVLAQSENPKLPQSPQLLNGIQDNPAKAPDFPQVQKVASIQANEVKVPDSPQLQSVASTQVQSEISKDKIEGSQSRSFSPILDHKLRNLKANEVNGTRGSSPMALLMAAKEREKHRMTNLTSQEDSISKEPRDELNTNFSVITNPMEERLQENTPTLKPIEQPITIQAPEKSTSSPSNGPALSKIPPTSSNLTQTKQSPEESPQMSQAIQEDEEFNMMWLPPPAEFGDFDDITEPTSTIDPPAKEAEATQVVCLPATPLAPSSPSPSLELSPVLVPSPPTTPAPVPTQAPPPPPPPPQLPPSDIDIAPKPQVQTKSNMVPTQIPPNLSPSQATLLSILQKKMQEMDPKTSPTKEAEPTSEDWNTDLPVEDKIPVSARVSPQIKTPPAVNKVPTLDMRELENKVIKKYQENSQSKFPISKERYSKNQFGKTFTIRPGSKQPITLVTDED